MYFVPLSLVVLVAVANLMAHMGNTFFAVHVLPPVAYVAVSFTLAFLIGILCGCVHT